MELLILTLALSTLAIFGQLSDAMGHRYDAKRG